MASDFSVWSDHDFVCQVGLEVGFRTVDFHILGFFFLSLSRNGYIFLRLSIYAKGSTDNLNCSHFLKVVRPHHFARSLNLFNTGAKCEVKIEKR